MTDMQLLIPPCLEETRGEMVNDERKRSDEIIKEDDDDDDEEEEGVESDDEKSPIASIAATVPVASATNATSMEGGARSTGEVSIMSSELRDQFETMKTAWRRARRSSGNADEEELTHKREKSLAFDTAIAIETELQKWKNGIAELEAMLAEDGDNTAPRDDDTANETRNHHHVVVPHPREVVRFPSLPPVVPAEDDDFDRINDNGDSAVNDHEA